MSGHAPTRQAWPAGTGQDRRAILIGLIGHGVGPSLSPAMHQLEGARHGMHYVYRTIDVADAEPAHLQQLIHAARSLGFNGLNITHPFKQTVLGLLDELSPGAAQVGAVNTVLFESGKMIGFNTDVTGFGAAFGDAFAGTGQGRVVLLGAGGGGAAVATALAGRNIEELVIVDTDPARAQALAASASAHTGAPASVRAAQFAELPELLAGADGIINATPNGMAAQPAPAFDTALLRPGHWVADIVYRPAETRLLADARRRGCAVMPGLGMAMGQAADAFEIFTGVSADRAAMMADLRRLVETENVSDAGETESSDANRRPATMPATPSERKP